MRQSVSAGQVSDSELDAILSRYGDTKSGSLTQAEGTLDASLRGESCALLQALTASMIIVRKAFGNLGLPVEYADHVFKSMDLSQAGKVSRNDLKFYVSRKMKRLRAAFAVVDRWVPVIFSLPLSVCLCDKSSSR